MANSKCRWECPDQWSQWSEWLSAGLHARNRWRVPVLMAGILLANGRRTVTTWLRAAGVSDDFQDYYYFLAAVGRKSNSIATQLIVLLLRTLPLPERLLLVVDDSPTKRYGPKVEGADPAKRKDAALRDLPTELKRGQHRGRGRPRKYVRNKLSLAKRAGHKLGRQTVERMLYGKTVTKTYKTFLATYAPVGRTIRVVLVHDVKEVWGSGQQQVRNVWTNLAVYNLNLWMHTLIELWSWDRSHEELCDRNDSPWDDALRRPSDVNRRNALRQPMMQNERSTLQANGGLKRKFIDLAKKLMALAT